MFDFVPQSVRECLSLTELAVCDDPVDRAVTIAVETLKLEEGVAIGPVDLQELRMLKFPGTNLGESEFFC